MSITIHCDTLTDAQEITELMLAGFSEMGEMSDISSKNTDVFIGETNEPYSYWYEMFDDEMEPYDEEEDDDNEG